MSSLLLAEKKADAKSITEKHLEIQMEKEKKYSREQTFYSTENYDFKGAEVNPESLKNITIPEVQDDFDMDSVYD
jgi:hypothetical protein